jgi:nucleoside-diphosphate-sugar epimerase
MAPYAVAKVAAEKYLHYMQYAYEFPFVILRQTNTYGRQHNDFFVMERIITQMLAGDVCNLGEGDPVRNFLYIDDLIDLYEVILEKRPLGNTFVTGPANGITIRRLVYMIADMLGWKGTINWNTIPKRPGEIYYLNSSPTKAKILLGWEPKVSLEEGIKRTIDMLRVG